MSFIAGLVGAFIGATASIGTIWIQQIHQSRRDRARLVVEAAIRDQTSAAETAKFLAEKNPNKQFLEKDLGYYIALHSGLMGIVENPGKLGESEWVKAYSRAQQLNDAISSNKKSTDS